MLTNLYLHPDDEAVLSSLPASVITKTRWTASWAGSALCVDEFHGHLSGLVLAEAELGPDDEPLDMPDGAVRDVTHNDRFSGGALAAADPAWLSAVLAEAARDAPA